MRTVSGKKGAYRLRITLSLSDKAGNPVSYSLAVIDPRRPFDWLATKSGTTRSGTASFSFRVRPAKRTQMLRLKVDAGDPVGNQTSFGTTLRLK